MTKNELNRDIRRLYKRWRNWATDDGHRETTPVAESEKWGEHDAMKRELDRLWRADAEMTYVTLATLKMLLVLNQSLRVIPLHHIASRIAL